jgi:2'-hydroxyisoflavone reductase
MAPGDGTDPVQVIDARDLSEWMIRLAERRRWATTTVCGVPRTPRIVRSSAARHQGVDHLEATFTWSTRTSSRAQGAALRRDAGVEPARDGSEGFARFDLTREVKLGLTFRPLAVTAKDRSTTTTRSRRRSRPRSAPASRRSARGRCWRVEGEKK